MPRRASKYTAELLAPIVASSSSLAESCGISEWQGRPLVLQLDHINGINSDNRLTNVRVLCPNCHSHTDTYCNRRRTLPSGAREGRDARRAYRVRAIRVLPRAWRNW
jgi:hypothetical protein